MKLIHNDYLKTSGQGNTWAVEIGPPSRPVKSYFEEAIIAAEMIWSKRQGTLYLSYSGGLDSEFALSVFRHLGMPVTPVIMQTQYNDYDMQYAFKYCKNNNIDPLIINLDFDKFVESGKFFEIATSMECATWQVSANMWLCSQLDDTVVTGGAEPHLKKKDGNWYLDEQEHVYDQLTYFKQHKIYGTPFFLSYTPEMMLSFLIDPTMELLGNDQIPGKLGNASTKVHVYNNNGGAFQLSNRRKQTGYEKVEDTPIFNHPDIQAIIGKKDQWGGSSDHQYHKLVSALLTGNTSKALD
jgi:hypothetical protein